MPSELAASFGALLSSIRSSSDYQSYLQLRQKMEQNSEIKKLILEVKNLQKEMVRLETRGESIQSIDAVYQEKLSLLSSYPLYQEFVQKQAAVNEILQIVKQEIESFFTNLVEND